MGLHAVMPDSQVAAGGHVHAGTLRVRQDGHLRRRSVSIINLFLLIHTEYINAIPGLQKHAQDFNPSKRRHSCRSLLHFLPWLWRHRLVPRSEIVCDRYAIGPIQRQHILRVRGIQTHLYLPGQQKSNCDETICADSLLSPVPSCERYMCFVFELEKWRQNWYFGPRTAWIINSNITKIELTFKTRPATPREQSQQSLPFGSAAACEANVAL